MRNGLLVGYAPIRLLLRLNLLAVSMDAVRDVVVEAVHRETKLHMRFDKMESWREGEVSDLDEMDDEHSYQESHLMNVLQ